MVCFQHRNIKKLYLKPLKVKNVLPFNQKIGATTLSITTRSIMTFSIMTLSIMTLSIMAFSITIKKKPHSA